ncbi:polysaccharide deacetylase family protein [Oleidesulfovibrio sp.]|uniref:polysaccharide deacetylase family protein n=1 Tax=Oleidesulfovibrio sp. TaxID=2909707 RepID=UPI003A85BA73
MTKSLPVLMYHYISKCEGSISVHPEVFEDHCKALAENGWRGISLTEAEQYLLHGTPLPKKSVLFTFDDGYLDNYVYAWPILKRYGHKGTIFAVTSRIEHHSALRPTIEDILEGRARRETLPPVDTPFQELAQGLCVRQDSFISWSEARAMESSGVISIAAHSTTHNNVFASPQFSSFIFPRSRGRTFYQVEGENLWGMPAFPAIPALVGRAFVPSANLLDTIRRHVPQDAELAYEFARDEEKVEALRNRISRLTADELGTYESDSERDHRMAKDFELCRNALEKELGHTRQTFCWPWGTFSPEALSIAKQHGFKVFFTTAQGANPPRRPEAVHRFKVKNKSAKWLHSRVKIYSNNLTARLYNLIRK